MCLKRMIEMKTLKMYTCFLLCLCITAVSTTSAVKIKYSVKEKTVSQAHEEVFNKKMYGNASKNSMWNTIYFE